MLIIVPAQQSPFAIELREKLVKLPTTRELYVLQFADVLSSGVTITSIFASSLSPNTATLESISVITVDTIVDGVTILANKGIQFEVSGGTDPMEYVVRVTLLLSDSSTVELIATVLVSSRQWNYYGSIVVGDAYFNMRIGTTAWTEASAADKMRALWSATMAVDRLNFAGCLADENQALQFPRDEDTVVPLDVERAVYEEAHVLLDGVDPQAEAANLSAISRGFSSVRTTYDRTSVPDNVANGIMSISAWRYLVPFLRNSNELDLSRAN